MVNVTKPFLPPLEEYNSMIAGIWERNWLTNNGPLVNELELNLKEYLKVKHLLYTTNGTMALHIAIKALALTGEIITTPFSFIATTSSIVWEGCKPVFVDIDPDTLNLDVSRIEAAITPETSAILATHIYGNPCDIEQIDLIAKKHGLKVIYDAAHCFGSVYNGKSVFSYGDISIVSFHATKLFHTIEGGAVFTNDPELLKQMAFIRNFGFNGPESFECLGTNGKNSEVHAAMGIVNLRYANAIIQKRRDQTAQYDKWMQGLDLKRPATTNGATTNAAYYPVLFKDEASLLKAESLLQGHFIYPRRYFYPSLNTLNYVPDQDAPVCDDVCKRVLCLPLYHTLSFEEIDFVCRLLLRAQNN